MTNENWGAETLRQPVAAEGDTVLFAEHGRILDKIDHRSHSFKVVKAQYGGTYLLVRHGGGDERMQIDYSNRIAKCFEPLDSDTRYYLLRRMYESLSDAKRGAASETATKYAQAFAEGRLKKRRRNHRVYVEIEPPAVAAGVIA